MKDYRMSLVISFVLKLKGDERIDRDDLWDCLAFYHYESMQGNGVMHGVKWMSVGNDEMVKMVFLYLIYSCFVWLV